MCGIVAIYSPRRAVADGAVQRAIQRLQHRGPDARITGCRKIGAWPSVMPG
jgi:asparagine synthetase B (glutamine-hydrolysing)